MRQITQRVGRHGRRLRHRVLCRGRRGRRLHLRRSRCRTTLRLSACQRCIGVPVAIALTIALAVICRPRITLEGHRHLGDVNRHPQSDTQTQNHTDDETKEGASPLLITHKTACHLA